MIESKPDNTFRKLMYCKQSRDRSEKKFSSMSYLH